MTESRTLNSIKNLKYGILNTLLVSILPFVTRTFFIHILGNDYLGIDAVFLNIINLIEIVNIGVGSAITYSVYKPIADGNTDKCRTLFRLYRNCYYVMGIIVLVVGVSLTPFLNVILKNKPNIPENIYVIYLLILSGVVSFYFFADKQCVINAHQKGYIISKVRMVVICFINIAEIFFLILTRKYMVYLIIQTCQNTIIYLFVYIKAKKMYPQFFGGKTKPLEKEDKSTIIKNTVALIFNRAGSLIINCTDSIIISTFVGVGSTGLYSNYLVLKNMVNNFTALFTSSLTASVGNLNATEDDGGKNRLYEIFLHSNFINYIIHAFCSICLFCLLEPFIKIWVGESYCMGTHISLIVTANFYFLGVQKTAEQFKSACGLYWQDRYRVFVESILNLIISLILVKPMGVLGVLLGTLISNICVTFWVEPLIIYKHSFKRNVFDYYKINIKFLFIAVLLTFVIWSVNTVLFPLYGGIFQFVLRTFTTVVLSGSLLCLVFIRNRHFKETFKMGIDLLKTRILKLG